jgi:thymidylate synthase (FAD)
MKHQAGLTWNEESRRYIDYIPDFYQPEQWRARPEKSIKQGSAGVVEAAERVQACYDKAVQSCIDTYEDLLSDNVAPELARMVLPQSMMVNFIWTGNLLAFIHVYGLRSGEGAQEEAKEFAQLLKEAIEPEFKISWKALENR